MEWQNLLEEDEALIMDFLFDFIDPECLVAYLSFDNVNMAQNLILDEGPYQNHAHFDGPVSFEHNNYSCENTTIIKDGGEIYFNGSNFQNKPRYGVTVAMWLYADSLLHRQSLFSTKAVGSVAGKFIHFLV